MNIVIVAQLTARNLRKLCTRRLSSSNSLNVLYLSEVHYDQFWLPIVGKDEEVFPDPFPFYNPSC